MDIYFGIVRDVILLVALFGLTIFIHELGHFLAAIWSGMVVEVFSIGFGPAIWKKKIRGITVKIAWIPFGGYVSIPQLDPTAMASVQGADGEGMRHALPPVAAWKKILVSLAGVTGNMILAVLLAWVVYLSPDVITEEGNTVIGFVDEGSAAYEAGVRAGETILSVNGERVRTWTEFTVLCVLSGGEKGEVTLEIESADGLIRQVALPTAESDLGFQSVEGLGKASMCAVGEVFEGSAAEKAGIESKDIIRSLDGTLIRNQMHLIELVGARAGQSVALVIERSGRMMELAVTPEFNEEHKRAMIGISFAEVQAMPWMQYKRPWAQVSNDAAQVFRMLKALVNPKESKQAAKGLGGPPMILMTLWVSIRISFINAIGFIRFLNVNLAVLNLLPIPVLDGGHLVFALWESVTRRKAPPKLVNALVNIFAVLLIGAILMLTFRDFLRMPKMLKAREGTSLSQDKDPEETVKGAEADE